MSAIANKLSLTVEKVSDIANLPWSGDPTADRHLFDAVDDYLLSLKKRPDTQMLAYKQLVRYGMGVRGQPTKADLTEYIREAMYDRRTKRRAA